MSKKALAQQAYEALKKAIVYNELEPGTKLSIAHLKEQFGFGLSPLREALSRLAAIGLLESQCMRGYAVPQLSHENFKDLYRARILIESVMLEESVAQATEADELNLVGAFHRFKKVEDALDKHSDFTLWQERHKDFLRALIAGCHSPSLLAAQKMYYEQSERYRSLWFHYSHKKQHATMRSYAKQHQEFYDAFMARGAKRLVASFQNKATEWQAEVSKCINQYLDESSQ